MALLAGAGPMGLGAIDYTLHGPRQPRLLVVTDIDQVRLDRAASIFPPEEATRCGVDLRYVNTQGADAVETQPLRAASIDALVAQGVGMIFAVVLIGVLVGMLIITATIYTATVEQLNSFAILKALGATRWQIWRVVLEQAVIQTVVSFGLGLAASLALNYAIETMSGIRALFPVPALAASLVAMVLLAVLGSLLSVRRALAVDPMLVFRA